MRLPLWVLRRLHRNKLTRHKLRGTFLHSWLGDRLLDRALWRAERDSLAKAWLVGFPITMVPFLPFQSVLACLAALFVRGNLLLCILLQFLSNPLTATVQLPLSYVTGEAIRGRSPHAVWDKAWETPASMLSADAIVSLYIGAIALGLLVGAIGYALIQRFWRPLPLPLRKKAATGATSATDATPVP